MASYQQRFANLVNTEDPRVPQRTTPLAPPVGSIACSLGLFTFSGREMHHPTCGSLEWRSTEGRGQRWMKWINATVCLTVLLIVRRLVCQRSRQGCGFRCLSRRESCYGKEIACPVRASVASNGWPHFELRSVHRHSVGQKGYAVIE